MSKNLQEKIMLLLDDLRSLNKYEAAAKLERFIIEETKFLQTEHVIGPNDLSLIKSVATREFVNIDPRKLNDRGYDLIDDARSWCYLEAIVMFLRGKGLISCTFKYDKSKRG